MRALPVRPGGTPKPPAAAQIGLLAFDTLTRAAVGLVVGTFVAILLGPDQFGQLTFGLSIVSMVMPLATLGTDPVLVQRLGTLAPAGREEAALIGTAFRLRAVVAVGVAVLIVLVAVAQPTAGQRVVLLFLAPAVAGVVFDVAYPWVIVRDRAGPLIVFRLAFFAVITLARIVAIVAGLPLAAFAALAAADLIVPGLAAWLTARHSGAWQIRYDRLLRPELLHSSLPLLLSGLLMLVMFRIAIVFIERILGMTAVGIYGAVVRLSEVAYLLPNLVVPTMASRIVAASPVGTPEYYRRYGLLAFRLMAAGTTIAAATAVLRTPFIGIYGEAYASGAPILAVHVFALVPLTIAAVRERLLVDARLTRASALNTFGGLVANVALNLILLPRIGLVGAAWATVAAYTVAAIGVPLVDPRQRPILAATFRATFRQ
jgi:O-antigen/teichoic acid export membrane protein